MSRDKLAIFDFDGTLFNTDEVNYHAYSEAVKPFGGIIDHERFITEFNGKHYTTFIPQILGGTEKLEEVHEAKKRLYREYIGYAKMNDHLFDIIRALRGEYNIALVTTASRKNVDELLEHFGVTDLFDLIISQENITKTKPDPEGFLKAMGHFRTAADKTYIYEDSDVGIEAARRTGASVIVVDRYVWR